MTDADQVCHNESVWYQPLTPESTQWQLHRVERFRWRRPRTTWKYSGNRGSFVGTFQVTE